MKKATPLFEKLILSIVFLVISTLGSLKAQSGYLQLGINSSPYNSQGGTLQILSNNISLTSGNVSLTNGNIGIGITTPLARLHIKSSGFTTQPLFQTEVKLGTALLATVQQCLIYNGRNYGIYQTSDPSSNLLNSFQDPVSIGNMTIGADGVTGQSLVTGLNVNNIKFTMRPSINNNPVDPLTINTNGITVKSNLVTDHFQMTYQPGANFILASDASGNGRWIDPTAFVDYWKPNGLGDIYTDYRRVGIGTHNPSRSLEICHTDENGGLVLNQTSTNSTIDATEIRFERSGVEKFATGYCVDYTDHPRPYYFIWSHIDKGNGSPLGTVLFIDGVNGMTGIGTSWPQAKLDVEGDLRVKDKVGIGCVPPTDPLGLYKLFVEGGIEARDIKVTIKTFPDYCFDDDYKLMSLSDLGNYISENKHLPNMPSAKEVAENKGFELGDMQTKLVEKVEEQTLYILDLQKQINDLKKQLECLIKQ